MSALRVLAEDTLEWYLWRLLCSRGSVLFSLERDKYWLLPYFDNDVRSFHKAVETLYASGRIIRLRRGIYRLANQDLPSIFDLLLAIHPDRDLRLSGLFALKLRLGMLDDPPTTVYVFRQKQARSFTLKPKSISNTSKALRVEYVREDPRDAQEIDPLNPLLATKVQAVLDCLGHASFETDFVALRKCLRQMETWPPDIEIKSANAARRLGLLVYEECSQRLEVPLGGSRATILLDSRGKDTGPITHPWNVRRNT